MLKKIVNIDGTLITMEEAMEYVENNMLGREVHSFLDDPIRQYTLAGRLVHWHRREQAAYAVKTGMYFHLFETWQMVQDMFGIDMSVTTVSDILVEINECIGDYDENDDRYVLFSNIYNSRDSDIRESYIKAYCDQGHLEDKDYINYLLYRTDIDPACAEAIYNILIDREGVNISALVRRRIENLIDDRDKEGEKVIFDAGKTLDEFIQNKTEQADKPE